MSHIWHVQDLDAFKLVILTNMTWQSTNQIYAFCHGSRPVWQIRQIRQISYIYLLEKDFGKAQLAQVNYANQNSRNFLPLHICICIARFPWELFYLLRVGNIIQQTKNVSPNVDCIHVLSVYSRGACGKARKIYIIYIIGIVHEK